MYEKLWGHPGIAYGGDYNPEQWDEAVWEEDMRLFRRARIDTVTLNVFSWAALQSDDETYHFEILDKIMDMVARNGLRVVLATSTAAHPAWMARKYPEILRTDAWGRKRKFGGRHNSCPNSPLYRKFSARLAGKLAERYARYDNIIAWHISNEYGGECYCENCENAFRDWLRRKYATLDELNRCWDTSFWGHTFYDWDEIVAPNYLSEHFAEERTMFQGISLDYRRFQSDSILECYRLEYAAVKQYTPDIPVTTNLMGFYKSLDYQKWADYMDIISWDNYPAIGDAPAQIAMPHDLMRGLSGGRPFLLMEQTPSVTNWHPFNALKRPGVMRLWSYQAIARGADSVLFFQMRRSIGACEKYHGAVIDHAGHGDTRVFREVAQLGEELAGIGTLIAGSVVTAQTAILFDWDTWWAVEYSAGPNRLLKYKEEIQNYYTALFDQNIPVDFIGMGQDFGAYKVIAAPLLYMLKPGVAERLTRFVEAGGILVTTFFSGYADEHDLVITGGYPGPLRGLVGVWVEESDALPEDKRNYFTWKGQRYEAKLLCDLLHPEGAQTLACYEEDFYAGMPALTCNRRGKGCAYYVAARSEPAFYEKLMETVCAQAGIAPCLRTPGGVEASVRRGADAEFLFLLNHTETAQCIPLRQNYVNLLNGKQYKEGDNLFLPAYGVAVLTG